LAIKDGEEGILENVMEQIPAPFYGRLESEKEGKVPSPQRESRERAKKKCSIPKQRIVAVKRENNIARTITKNISHLQTSQR
jgi:hypothetical protein